MDTDQHPSLWRRLAAVFYDSLCLFGVLLAATQVALLFNHGKAIPSGTLWFQCYLVGVVFTYFAWFWCWHGQTVGMRAWKLYVCNYDGKRIGFVQALVRFVGAWLSLAVLGLGLLWSLIDKRRFTWYDHASRTRLVYAA